MKIYGIQKTTLLDYPGEVACTLFTAGCNFRCGYCHNPDLVINTRILTPIEWSDIFEFLKERRKLIGGVCITGGEPLIYDEIQIISEDIHSIGLKVKIDTNGSFPQKLKIINADYIAMDIKTSPDRYRETVYQGNEDISKSVLESINWIINSGVAHEFRTTVVPGIVTIEDITKISSILKNADKYVLTQFRPQNTLDKKMEEVIPYLRITLEEMKEIVINNGVHCEIRGDF